MALTAIERTRVEQAVEALARYNKPFITDFVSKKKRKKGDVASDERQDSVGIPQSKYDKNELVHDLIGKILLGEYTGRKKYQLSLGDLVKHLDKLQETGRQHLYLFKLPDDMRGTLLSRLREPREVRAMFGGEDDVYEHGHTVWEAREGPQLALVRYDAPAGSTEPQCLVLKWIETRVYFKPKVDPSATLPVKARIDDDQEEQGLDEIEEAEESDEAERERLGEKIHISLRFEERAATFFVVHLASGECELRIQAVRGRGRSARQNQLALYAGLISNFLGVDLVGPTILAPAIRRTLIVRDVPIVRCEAILPDGALYIGKKRGQVPSVDPRHLLAGVIIRFDWPQAMFGTGRVELDGRLDEIGILRPLRPDCHKLLLDGVRQWRQEGIGVLESRSEPSTATASRVSQSSDGVSVPTLSSDALMVLKAVFGQNVPTVASASQPEMDRAIREYVHTHSVDEQQVAIGVQQSEGAVTSPSVISGGRSFEQFLDLMSDVAKSDRSTFQREIRVVQREERRYFQLSVIAAVLALIVVATGSFLLIFFPAKIAVATVTAILGLITGRGTLITRSSMKSLRAKRELILKQQTTSHETLLAIQSALAIPDASARSQAMADVSSILLSRVKGLTADVTVDRETESS